MSLTVANAKVLPVLDDLKDALRPEIKRVMALRNMQLSDLGKRFGYKERRVADISRYLRGMDCDFGHVSALGLAKHLGIPVRFEVGKPVPIQPTDPIQRHRDPFAARPRLELVSS
jgi:hypothetical protein